MYLVLSIVLSTILGYLLLMFGPLVGGFLAFGIIVGCLFRGLYLLHDIRKRLSEVTSISENEMNGNVDYLKNKDMYLNYLKDKENKTKDI